MTTNTLTPLLINGDTTEKFQTLTNNLTTATQNYQTAYAATEISMDEEDREIITTALNGILHAVDSVVMNMPPLTEAAQHAINKAFAGSSLPTFAPMVNLGMMGAVELWLHGYRFGYGEHIELHSSVVTTAPLTVMVGATTTQKIPVYLPLVFMDDLQGFISSLIEKALDGLSADEKAEMRELSNLTSETLKAIQSGEKYELVQSPTQQNNVNRHPLPSRLGSKDAEIEAIRVAIVGQKKFAQKKAIRVKAFKDATKAVATAIEDMQGLYLEAGKATGVDTSEMAFAYFARRAVRSLKDQPSYGLGNSRTILEKYSDVESHLKNFRVAVLAPIPMKKKKLISKVTQDTMWFKG